MKKRSATSYTLRDSANYICKGDRSSYKSNNSLALDGQHTLVDKDIYKI